MPEDRSVEVKLVGDYSEVVAALNRTRAHHLRFLTRAWQPRSWYATTRRDRAEEASA